MCRLVMLVGFSASSFTRAARWPLFMSSDIKLDAYAGIHICLIPLFLLDSRLLCFRRNRSCCCYCQLNQDTKSAKDE
jgi:hypothetical protein